jgi:hypothetical protein
VAEMTPRAERPRAEMPRRIATLLLLALLAGCAGSGAAPSSESPAETATTPDQGAAAPAACPETLAYIKDKLVTPYPELETFIGKAAADATFSKPIDQMITESGGIEASIVGGEHHVKEYEDELKDVDARRAELKQDGMSDDWIDTYFLTVKDGITINQAFVDSVKCRQARLQQSDAPPAG